MAEYIRKEDIEQKIQDGLNNLVLGYDAIEVLGMIYEMPSADVAPVRHGRWFPTAKWWQGGSAWKQCSECGILHLGKSNFCHNCGCKMDLEG